MGDVDERHSLMDATYNSLLQGQVLLNTRKKPTNLKEGQHNSFSKWCAQKGFFLSLCQCIGGEEVTYILREIYKGIYNNHARGFTLAQKVLQQVYF